MKPDSLSAYRGKRFIDQRMDDLGSHLNTERARLKIIRKCNHFIIKVDTIFNALPFIWLDLHRKYVAKAIKRQLEYELYNDLKFNTGAKNNEDALKDEIYGYVKFKANFYSKRKS